MSHFQACHYSLIPDVERLFWTQHKAINTMIFINFSISMFYSKSCQDTCSRREKEVYEVGWGRHASCWGDWATLQLFIWQRFGVAEAYVQVLFELPGSPFYNHYDNRRLSPLWSLWQQKEWSTPFRRDGFSTLISWAEILMSFFHLI